MASGLSRLFRPLLACLGERGVSEPRRGSGLRTLACQPLEDRCLLSLDPMGNVGTELAQLYNDYLAAHLVPATETLAQLGPGFSWEGDAVLVEVHGAGDASRLLAELNAHQLRTVCVWADPLLVSGYLPLEQLAEVATLPQTLAVLPVHTDLLTDSQGTAANQAETTLEAGLLRQLFDVDGTGITVGVISDSANLVSGGIATSQASGDLPPGSRTQDLLEVYTSGTVDEGRAMMELIYDIAPGADLRFASGGGTDAQFATAVNTLVAAGCDVIVDDLNGLTSEPYLQDGLAAQAVANAIAGGVSYYASAGNRGNSGYEAPFTGINATVAGIAGRWNNFGSGDTTQTVTLGAGTTTFVFQYDDPFYGGGGVTRNIDFYILNAAGDAILRSGTDNNLTAGGTGVPREIVSVTVSSATTVQIAIRQTSGATDITRIKYIGFNAPTIVDHLAETGAAVAATNPGHSSVAATVAAAASYWGTPTVYESYSSQGPSSRVFDVAGNRLAAVMTINKPDVTSNDGTATSVPGFSGFYGTSAAAPNAAAIGALLLELAPSATPAQIKSALTIGALDLNTTGYDLRTGYGLVQSVDAGLVLTNGLLPINGDRDATGQADTLRLRVHAGDASLLDVTLNGTLLGAVPRALLDAVEFNGLTGNDTLIVDFANGDPTPEGGITFHGGTGTADAMSLTGGSVARVEYVFANEHDGSVLLDGATAITYTGLAPISDNLSVADRVLSYAGGAESITLADAGIAGTTFIDSTLGESLAFANPTSSLRINSATGNDTIDLAGLGSGFNADLTISAPPATVNVTGLIDLGAGELAVTATTVTIDAGGDLAAVGTINADTLVSAAGAFNPAGGATGTLVNNGPLTFGAGGQLVLQVNGTAAGASVDRITAVGSVTIDPDAMLDVQGTISAAPGLPIVLVDNDGTDPISGAFAGLPEGATVIVNGISFAISYHGGTGNDIALAAGLSGQVFNDLNGSGARDPGEPGLGRWTVFLDDNQNGVLDTSVATRSTGAINLSVAENSTVVSNLAVSGLGGAIKDLNVKLNLYNTYDSAITVYLISPTGARVQLFGGVGGSGRGFINTILDDEASQSITTGSATFSGSWQPMELLSAFDGQSPNGDWKLQVVSSMTGSGIGTLYDWSLTFSNAEISTTTSADSASLGSYAFLDLPVGTYYVAEVQQSGWAQTMPLVPRYYTVALPDSGAVNNNDFGNYNGGWGVVWSDQNGNGIKDAAEPVLPGQTVYMDLGNDGSVDRSAVTNAAGVYTFGTTPVGTHKLLAEIPSGAAQSAPASPNYYLVAITQAGQVVAGRNFGFYQMASIRGQKFNDLDGDGVQDADEPGLSGWSIQLDLANNGTVDRTAVTDANGDYVFDLVAPGSHRLAEVAQTGWVLTAPSAPGAHVVTLASGSVAADQDFGGFQLVTISGQKFNDLDGDGVQDSGESGLAGWTIAFDQNGDGSVDRSTITDNSGTFSFTGVGPGTHLVSEVVRTGWTRTLPATAYTVVTRSGQSTGGLTFGDFQLVTLSGLAFNDVNGNGAQYTDGDKDPGETGLAGWTIELDLNNDGSVDRSTITGTDGRYSFADVTPGTHKLAEVVPAGWSQTAPASLAHLVTTASGVSVADRDFGNHQSPPTQSVASTQQTIPGKAGMGISIPVIYTTNTADNTLTGLGLRIHYNSTVLTYAGLSGVLPTNLSQQQSPLSDVDDSDEDPTTDRYVLVSWADYANGTWPNAALPLQLLSASFTVAAGAADGTQTQVKFSASATAAGYGFSSQPVTVQVGNASLEVDGNGRADALTDGIMILRYLFDPDGDWALDLGAGATRTTRSAIKTFLDDGKTSVLDVDGNGTADALTDGILTLRYLFDPTGEWSFADALGVGAKRTTRAQLKTFLDLFNPAVAPGAGADGEGLVESLASRAASDALPITADAPAELAIEPPTAGQVDAEPGQSVVADLPLAGLAAANLGGGSVQVDLRTVSTPETAATVDAQAVDTVLQQEGPTAAYDAAALRRGVALHLSSSGDEETLDEMYRGLGRDPEDDDLLGVPDV